MVPPNSKVGTLLSIFVYGKDGIPAEEGVLRLAGCAIPVSGGRGEIPFELFVGGVRDSEVSFARKGDAPVPGTLCFFGTER